ncbi:type III secretion system chaperone [Pantoea anthophila]|uniref:type III secretion system chaperone n=1 Tax=Pantoea anthophila TaxID=470931 RepID=UPI002DBA7A43|nr:type III secretion system chaperone [Pantoea anthophila]MEB7539523.1 type III secretion system chaperone [Pantoea anthophila]
MTQQQEVQRLLDDFGRRQGIALTLDNGVCALQDEQGREAVVLELPPGSDTLLLHCQLFASARLAAQLVTWQRLMKLNFDMYAMRGCWLALDEEEQMRLCYHQPLAGLTPAAFNALMLAFIHQAQEVRTLLPEMLAA